MTKLKRCSYLLPVYFRGNAR